MKVGMFALAAVAVIGISGCGAASSDTQKLKGSVKPAPVVSEAPTTTTTVAPTTTSTARSTTTSTAKPVVTTTTSPPTTTTAPTSSGVSFANCSEAKAAGYSDIPRGAPGYASKLDRDNDGIACES